MQTETIEIPESASEMRIKHLPFLLALIDFEGMEPADIPIEDIVHLNALFLGVEIRKLYRYQPEDNRRLFMEINSRLSEHVSQPLPLRLEYEGKAYTLRNPFIENPVDWKMDLIEAEPGFKDDPIDIVSFCYVEEGMAYGESTEQQTQKNPRHVRNAVFREHLPLSTFLDIQAFFLKSWPELQKCSTQEKIKREQAKRLKRKLKTRSNGKSRSNS